jgi:MFS superfamily sulfate permease-like transporter
MPMFRLARGLSASSYRREWLIRDIVAGIVLSTLLVPQGMAYAELAGLPPITGLYTSILCLLGYAVFGPSRVLVLGPDSSLGPMIAATILPLAGAGATRSGLSRWRRCSRLSSGASWLSAPWPGLGSSPT